MGDCQSGPNFCRGCTGDLPRYTHPSCKALFGEVVELVRTVCPGARDYFFRVGLNESLAMAAMDRLMKQHLESEDGKGRVVYLTAVEMRCARHGSG